MPNQIIIFSILGVRLLTADGHRLSTCFSPRCTPAAWLFYYIKLDNIMKLPFKAYWDLLSEHIRPQKGRFSLLVALLLTSIGLRVINPQVMRSFIDSALAGEVLQTLTLTAL
ncbi:MAG TPA: hypothetical protein DCG54_04575, partial [Anaerolineae bacterium]|nr:hypothetical protein [Anaerolineae bacterium]